METKTGTSSGTVVVRKGWAVMWQSWHPPCSCSEWCLCAGPAICNRPNVKTINPARNTVRKNRDLKRPS